MGANQTADAAAIHKEVRAHYARAAAEASSGAEPGVVSRCGDGD